MMISISQYLGTHPLLTCYFICHFLSDFQWQSQHLADKKGTQLAALGKHILIVALPLVALSLWQPQTWLITLLIIISHGLIDFSKPRVMQWAKLSPRLAFTIDQGLHLAIIIFLSSYLREISSRPMIFQLYLLNLILFLVLITKPTNIAFKIWFDKYQPLHYTREETIAGAGATIGNLERMMIGICLFLGQYATIGLVFTAKSIARYNKISENPSFAEYYLIGSLFSMLGVFFAACVTLI
nr:DUF3307 domain-containing protein [Streptococcus halichoeri]